ncbi:hypothetical protein NM688_g6552 [Phlebia brevispora]|uniref:Uncharacterized protein n=1 Tax=Phlebia brevispora TaxID=194682 RepID=A0ACC1SEQ5_9APHY|nr:hypothetical protein NM688_g6552 [Phlebia brevispora]
MEASDAPANGSFPEFFRMLVDESLFSSTASPERKYWGFQIFQKALPRVKAADMPMLFTKNFMRSWINHLSNSDRYLHKAAKQVANDIQVVVKNNPTLGFTLILQLTGVHGSHQFDKLTKTKTVETILTSMHRDGIQSYIEYLLNQVNDEQPSKETDIQALSARRAWIIEQLAALIRNGAVPKDDKWIQTVLDWFVVHGLFTIRKKSEKSKFLALRDIPNPILSDELRKACRTRLLNCLADLTTQTTLASKIAAVASDGEFWVSKVLTTVDELNQDTKHVKLLSEADEEDKALRQKARELAERLNKISGEQREAARGAELLLSATLLHQYCIDDDDEDDAETLQSCIDAAAQMFPAESKKSKKSRKSSGGAEPDEPKPVDVLVDTLIGFLEEATAYMRAVANQVFTLLSGSVQESTIDLILAQLERRTPEELAQDEDDDEDMGDAEEREDDEADETESSEESVAEDEDEDLDDAADPELRRKIEEALQVNGIRPATGDSDSESEEELMDDEQMMAIDEQLTAVFKARADEKKLGKGKYIFYYICWTVSHFDIGIDVQREATHYKNRVLDLLDTYIKKQSTNPLILRLVLPLVDLVMSSGSDEQQLADKTTGILRSRIGKAKEIPSDIDSEQAAEILRGLHAHARKAVSSEMLTTLSQCSLFITKCLLHAQVEAPVLDAYGASLADFVKRKASRLNTNFFQDLIRRHPSVAWGIRTQLLEVGADAVNDYRRTQVFLLLQTLFGQLPTLGDKHDEILEFVGALRPVIQATIRAACEDGHLTAPQMKEVLKAALLAVRQSKRVLSQDELRSAWDSVSWEEVSQTLASSDKFKSSTGLHNMCGQVVKLLDQKAAAVKPGKRKADTLADAQDAEAPEKKKKAKRSKA